MTRLLQSAYLFKTFNGMELDGISALGTSRTYHDGDQIFSKGEAATAVYFIKYGSVRIQQSMSNGDAVDIAILSTGSHFGEMSFVDGEVRSATAVALEHTELIEVPYERLKTFLAEHPAASLKFYQELSHYLCARLRVTTSDLSFAREKNLFHL